MCDHFGVFFLFQNVVYHFGVYHFSVKRFLKKTVVYHFGVVFFKKVNPLLPSVPAPQVKRTADDFSNSTLCRGGKPSGRSRTASQRSAVSPGLIVPAHSTCGGSTERACSF